MPIGIYTRTPEHIENMRQARLGKTHTPERIAKISQSNFGKKHTPETKEKIRRSRLGKNHSGETKEKLRQAKLGRKRTPEFREKMRQAKLGKRRPPFTEEWKEKMRLAHNTPESKEKHRQARLKQTFPTKMTSIEQLLYTEFKKRRLKFEMHKTMFGRFQPDFVFEEAKLIVHADGDYWHSLPGVPEKDKHCDELAHEAGYTVIRFTESVIKQDAAKCARAVAKFVKKHNI